MIVDTRTVNPALEAIFENPSVVIFLDTNIFIAPDRSSVGYKAMVFSDYRDFFLDPLFESLDNLSIHESVYDEMVADSLRAFADEKVNSNPAKLKIYHDSDLNKQEMAIYAASVKQLAKQSGYQPSVDNTKDRGEVRSLAYMHTKSFLYISSNDHLVVRLVTQPDKYKSGLYDEEILRMYELIYFLYRQGKYDKKGLRILYKYLYHATKQDAKKNPTWGEFITIMDNLYSNET